MEAIKKTAILALFIAIFSPLSASAMTWVTPSGAVVDDQGHLISPPPKVIKASVMPVFTGNPAKVCRYGGVQFGKATVEACKIYLSLTATK